jgi:hypothetical protein
MKGCVLQGRDLDDKAQNIVLLDDGNTFSENVI